MKSRLAFGEPLFTVSVRIPKVRLKSKDKRLRDRAAAVVDSDFKRFYGEKGYRTHVGRRDTRIETMLAERRAILKYPRKYRKRAASEWMVQWWW